MQPTRNPENNVFFNILDSNYDRLGIGISITKDEKNNTNNEKEILTNNKIVDQIKNIAQQDEKRPEKKSQEKLIPIEHEIADVFIYLIRIANKMGINIEDAVYKKMKLNRLKYPVESNQGVVNKT